MRSSLINVIFQKVPFGVGHFEISAFRITWVVGVWFLWRAVCTLPKLHAVCTPQKIARRLYPPKFARRLYPSTKFTSRTVITVKLDIRHDGFSHISGHESRPQRILYDPYYNIYMYIYCKCIRSYMCLCVLFNSANRSYDRDNKVWPNNAYNKVYSYAIRRDNRNEFQILIQENSFLLSLSVSSYCMRIELLINAFISTFTIK